MISSFLNSAMCGCAMLVMSIAPASAQRLDKKTVFTFSTPVRIGDTTLDAGQHVFKILDTAVQRDVVQVFNADGTKLEVTVIGNQTSRNRADDTPQFAFYDDAEGGTPALRTWFGAGDTIGLTFAISKPPMDGQADFTRHVSAAATRVPSADQPGQSVQ
jgi:hypothetical protein